MDFKLYLSGYILLPQAIMPSRKWLKVFEKWTPEAIAECYDRVVSELKSKDEDDLSLSEMDLLQYGCSNHLRSLAEELVKCDLSGSHYMMCDEFSSFMDTPHTLKQSPEFSPWQTKFATPNIEQRHPVYAKVTSISKSSNSKPEWLYINVSSYDFWKDVIVHIRENHCSINLGGWLLKLGEDAIIDSKFKDIIEAA